MGQKRRNALCFHFSDTFLCCALLSVMRIATPGINSRAELVTPCLGHMRATALRATTSIGVMTIPIIPADGVDDEGY